MMIIIITIIIKRIPTASREALMAIGLSWKIVAAYPQHFDTRKQEIPFARLHRFETFKSKLSNSNNI